MPWLKSKKQESNSSTVERSNVGNKDRTLQGIAGDLRHVDT